MMQRNGWMRLNRGEVRNGLMRRTSELALSILALSMCGQALASGHGAIPPLFLIVPLIWWLISVPAVLYFGYRFGRRLLALRHQPVFPALIVAVLAFFCTPVTNSHGEYVLAAVVWLGFVFWPWSFASSLATAAVACFLVAVAGWSILWVAGRLSFSAASASEKPDPPAAP